MMMSHVMAIEGHLHSHAKILVKHVLEHVPEHVLAMPISFTLQKYFLNHGLILCLSNRLEWVESSRYDSDQREFSRNIFDLNLEPSCCEYNLQNFHDELFQLQNCFCSNYSWNVCCLEGFPLGIDLHFSFFHDTATTCRKYLTYWWPSQRCCSFLLF